MLISIHELAFTFPGSEKNLFHHLNLEIAARQRRALIGPSGSGKTTLIQLIAGLHKPGAGKIVVDDQSLENLSEHQISQIRATRIGVIFQDYNLVRDLSVLDNLRLRCAIADQPFDETLADQLLARIEMSRFKHRIAAKLSGGQQQRIAAARALITKPAVILADEPTGNLDDESAQAIIELLFEEGAQHTLLIATHDQRVLTRCPHHLTFGQLDAVEVNP